MLKSQSGWLPLARWTLVLAMACVSCALPGPHRRDARRSRAPQPPADAPLPQDLAAAPPRTSSTVATKAERARAQALLERGLRGYHVGAYAEAEQVLKEAMELYPFAAQAHLTLGKIDLLRAAAAQDARRLANARRLVKMACRLDPTWQEAKDFLQLFAAPGVAPRAR